MCIFLGKGGDNPLGLGKREGGGGWVGVLINGGG